MADGKSRNILPPRLQVPTQAARMLDTAGRIIFLGLAWTLFLTVEDHQSVVFNVGLVVFGYMLYLIYDHRRQQQKSRLAAIALGEAAEAADPERVDLLAMDSLEFRNLFLRYLRQQGVNDPQRVEGGFQARAGGMTWYYGLLPPRSDGLVGKEAVERQINRSLALGVEAVTLATAGCFDPEALAVAGRAPLPLHLLSGPEILEGIRVTADAGAVPAPV